MTVTKYPGLEPEAIFLGGDRGGNLALGLAAIAYRVERRYALLEPGSALMLVVYGLGL